MKTTIRTHGRVAFDDGQYVASACLPRPPWRGPHPTRWLMTVADNGELGFMKDTAIYSETNPLPDC